MYIPEIPNNSLTEEITQIVELSKKLEENYFFKYYPPTTEEELSSWEKENSIKIPESLKDWLRFSSYSNICSELAIIKGVKAFKIDCELVPDEMVIIGEVIGDGQFIGFSKENGEIMWEDHGEVTRLKSFDIFLKDTVIRMLKRS